MTRTLNAAAMAKAEKHLATLIRYNNQVMTVKNWLHNLKKEGFKPDIKEVPAVEYNRTKYNRLTGWEQAEYEKRLKETKTEYRAINDRSILVITKTQFDYFSTL